MRVISFLGVIYVTQHHNPNGRLTVVVPRHSHPPEMCGGPVRAQQLGTLPIPSALPYAQG